MKVDLTALRAAISGDQAKKVEVKRAWLTAVYHALVDVQRVREDNARLKERIRILEEEAENDPFGKFEEKFENPFGMDGPFDKLFGKRRKR
jgi:Txe/YoeB family toxin of Txe-Axe toxin-antitoxin module